MQATKLKCNARRGEEMTKMTREGNPRLKQNPCRSIRFIETVLDSGFWIQDDWLALLLLLLLLLLLFLLLNLPYELQRLDKLNIIDKQYQSIAVYNKFRSLQTPNPNRFWWEHV